MDGSTSPSKPFPTVRSAHRNKEVPTDRLAAIVPSQEIIASDSTFIAHAAPCKSKQEAVRFQTHIREAHTSDPASHEMLAWRVLSLRDGADGTRGPEDFALTQGSDECVPISPSRVPY